MTPWILNLSERELRELQSIEPDTIFWGGKKHVVIGRMKEGTVFPQARVIARVEPHPHKPGQFSWVKPSSMLVAESRFSNTFMPFKASQSWSGHWPGATVPSITEILDPFVPMKYLKFEPGDPTKCTQQWIPALRSLCNAIVTHDKADGKFDIVTILQGICHGNTPDFEPIQSTMELERGRKRSQSEPENLPKSKRRPQRQRTDVDYSEMDNGGYLVLNTGALMHASPPATTPSDVDERPETLNSEPAHVLSPTSTTPPVAATSHVLTALATYEAKALFVRSVAQEVTLCSDNIKQHLDTFPEAADTFRPLLERVKKEIEEALLGLL